MWDDEDLELNLDSYEFVTNPRRINVRWTRKTEEIVNTWFEEFTTFKTKKKEVSLMEVE